MPNNRRCVYDLGVLKRLWAAGKTHLEIAAVLGCSECYVEKLRVRHGLPRRPRKQPPPVMRDPTEEEIASSKAEIRARNLEALRIADPKPVVSVGNIRCVAWDGFKFSWFA